MRVFLLCSVPLNLRSLYEHLIHYQSGFQVLIWILSIMLTIEPNIFEHIIHSLLDTCLFGANVSRLLLRMIMITFFNWVCMLGGTHTLVLVMRSIKLLASGHVSESKECLHRESNSGPSVHKTDAPPLSYKDSRYVYLYARILCFEVCLVSDEVTTQTIILSVWSTKYERIH